MKKLCFGEMQWCFQVLLIIRDNNLTGHYTSGVQMDNTWFFISATRVLRQKKFQCNLRDIIVPYILIYERRNDLLMPPSNLLNSTTGILSSDSAPDIMIRQSVIKQLEKQKTKKLSLRSKILL